MDFFTRAVGMHPDRLTNMYFAYLFLLRALAKAAPLLTDYDFGTGNTAEDAVTRDLVHALVNHQQVRLTVKYFSMRIARHCTFFNSFIKADTCSYVGIHKWAS